MSNEQQQEVSTAPNGKNTEVEKEQQQPGY